MSLIVELFGEEILSAPLTEVKNKIKNVPSDRKERRAYMLTEWSILTGTKVSDNDYIEVNS